MPDETNSRTKKQPTMKEGRKKHNYPKNRQKAPSWHDLGQRVIDLGDVRTKLKNENKGVCEKFQIEGMREKGYKNYNAGNLYRDLKDLMRQSTFLRDLTEFRLSHELEDSFEKLNGLLEDAYAKALDPNVGLKKDGTKSTAWHFVVNQLLQTKDKILSGDYVDISYALAHEKHIKQMQELEEKDKKILELEAQLKLKA